MGKDHYKMVCMANFQVVDYPRAYNITFGLPLLTTTIEAVFMHYFAMKIPTLKSVITIKGECYITTSMISY